MYAIVPEFEVSLANTNRERKTQGGKPRVLCSVSIHHRTEGTVVLSIFSMISAKTPPERFLFCEERQILKPVKSGRQPPWFYSTRQASLFFSLWEMAKTVRAGRRPPRIRFYWAVRRVDYNTIFPLEIVDSQIAQVNRLTYVSWASGPCSSSLCARVFVASFFLFSF